MPGEAKAGSKTDLELELVVVRKEVHASDLDRDPQVLRALQIKCGPLAEATGITYG